MFRLKKKLFYCVFRLKIFFFMYKKIFYFIYAVQMENYRCIKNISIPKLRLQPYTVPIFSIPILCTGLFSHRINPLVACFSSLCKSSIIVFLLPTDLFHKVNGDSLKSRMDIPEWLSVNRYTGYESFDPLNDNQPAFQCEFDVFNGTIRGDDCAKRPVHGHPIKRRCCFHKRIISCAAEDIQRTFG